MSKITQTFKKIRGLFPSRLPNGVDAFNAWAEDMAATYELPTTHMDSIKFTLSTIIMHLGPQAASKAMYYFVLTLRAGAAKQVAGQVFTDIKNKQKEEEAAKASEAANATQQSA